MARKFANNAFSLLASGITDVATTLTVTTGEGTKFPSPGASEYFMLALYDGANTEIVKVTARTTDSMTIVRAQEGTTARAFSAGAVVSHRLTAEALTAFEDHVIGTSAVHAASAISYAGNTGLSAADVEAALDELDNEKQPLDATLTSLAGGVIAEELTNTATSALQVPAGTSAQRPTGANGKMRYNTELLTYEGYAAGAWGSIGGGAKGAAGNAVFYENDTTVTGDYTITTGKNAVSAGPIEINTGVTVTVPTGSVWTIV